MRVTGDLAGPASEYEDFLGLAEGVIFQRSAVASAIDRLHEREMSRGNVSVYPVTEIDDEGRWIDIEVKVEDLDAPEPERPERSESQGEGPQLTDQELRLDPSLAPEEEPQ